MTREEDLREVLARATSPEERLRGGWVVARPDGAGADRADRWHQRVAKGDTKRAELVLAVRGLTTEDLRRSLSSAHPAEGGGRPDWARTAEALLESCTSSAPDYRWDPPTLGDIAGSGLPPGVPGSASWRFYGGFRGWLGHAAAEVDAWARDHAAPLEDHARRDLVLDLARRMLGVAGPHLVSLAASSTAAPFDGDVADRWLALWSTQPVTARLLAVVWRQWTAATRALIRAIGTDLPSLAPRRTVVAVTGGEGDRHGDGRTVVAVHLDSGARLFHKPRAVGPHRTLAAWFAAVDGEGEPWGLRLPTVHSCDGYAWVEEVRAESCATPQDVAAYYRRAGAQLRILQLLGATDLHHENFVPTATQPVLVDLETAMGHGAWAAGGRSADALTAVLARELADSAAATSMVTSFVDGAPGRRSVDIGAMAGPHERPTPYAVLAPTPRGAALDLVPQRPPLANGRALPRLDDRPIAVSRYAEDVVAGYRDAAERLARLASQSAGTPPTSSDVDDAVRFVVRATRVYVRLLQESLAPAALVDGAERELVLERLWLAVGGCPPEVITAEQAALRRLDVPVFWAPLGDRDVISDVGELIDGALDESPTAVLRRRGDALLSPSAVAESVEDLRATLFVVTEDEDGRPTAAGCPPAGPVPDCPVPQRDPVQTVAELDTALDVLLARARHTPDGTVAWVGLDLDPGRQRWRVGRLGPGLLGDAGIGLALAARAALGPASDARCADVARATLRTAAARMARADPTSFGDAFTGPAGTLYAVARGGALLDDADLVAAAESLLPAVLSAAAATGSTRLLDPVAGGVCACTHLPPSHQRDAAMDQLTAMLDPGDDRQLVGSGLDELVLPWSLRLPGRDAGRALARHRLRLDDGAAVRSGHVGDDIAAASLGAPLGPLLPDARTCQDWLDRAELARAAASAATASKSTDTLAEARDRLCAVRRATGSWFPDVLAPDSRNLSAVYGMAAVVLLGVAGHVDAPSVRVLA